MQQANTNVVNLGEKDVRQRLLEVLHRFNYKQVDVSKETGRIMLEGIHHSTLSLWLQGKIKGQCVRVEETIEEWMQNVLANKPRYSKNTGSKFAQMKSHSLPNDKLGAVDNLIPVRIDLEMEGRKFKDLVLWNANEPYFTAEQFAKLVAEENNLSANFENEIAKRAKSSHETVEDIKEECIRTIEIDVRIDNLCLKDRFEWDISETDNSPEDFAELLCNELGLNSEFCTQIAHQIREQLSAHKKINQDSDYGYADPANRFKKSRGGVDTMLKIGENSRLEPVTAENYLRPVQMVYLDDNDNLNYWEPKIQTFTLDEIKKHEQLEERKYRHERRGIRYA